MSRNKFRILMGLWLPLMVLALILAVGCQGKKASTPKETASPQEKVEIAESSSPTVSPTETPTEAPKPITGKFKRRTNRDPFIPVVAKPSRKRKGHKKPKPVAIIKPATPTPAVKPSPVKKEPEKPEIVEIGEREAGVRISGIMKVPGGYRAILTSTSGRSYNVRPGMKVGDWTVAQITSNSVILKAEGYIARLKLEENIGPGAKGSKKPTSSEKGPSAPKPPAPPR